MPLTINFRDGIDLPDWRALRITPNASAAGISMCSDLRNNETRIPYVYQLVSNTVLNRYNVKNDGWSFVISPALAGTFGAGAGCVFGPSRGPSGTVGSGCTSTSIVISTALPGAVGINQLANRGDGIGYTIRIIGNAAGSSGKTEERRIVSNTSGTTPTLTLDSALTFTPASGDRYEILSGFVYLLGAGTVASGTWRAYDVACNVMRTSLSTTNLPSSIGTGSAIVCLDELYTPSGRSPGEGFFGNLTATGSSSTSITGQASGGDSGVLANEYRNFQIRIVQDTSAPTSVGQRRRITSHTAGPSPVYTVSAWTVTPSSNAIFVIENPNYILRWGETTTTTYTYDTIADSWSTTTFGASGSAVAAGLTAFGGWGISALDATKRARYSNVFRFRGGGTALDVLDIAGGASGSWTNGATYNGQGTSLGAGTCSTYDPATLGGRYGYIVLNNSALVYRFDVLNFMMEEYGNLPQGIQGTAVAGEKLCFSVTINDNVKIGKLIYLANTASTVWDCLLLR